MTFTPSAQFDVGWDGQYAVIEPGKPYIGTVTEIKLQSTTNVRQSNTKFKLNGNAFTFSDARLIDGDTNYIQLREFAQKLTGTASQFNVYWDEPAGQAVIQPGVAYTGKGPAGSSTTPKPKGGINRTINMENLLTLEISNTYSYARIQGVAADGVTIVHFLVVPEGATIKCTKYVPPFQSEYWEKNHYFNRPIGRIIFENGALWPTVTYATEYDDKVEGSIGQGESITLVNGNEYNFDMSTSDKAITKKYGASPVGMVLRVFVVPNDIAAKIGGPKPKNVGQTSIKEYYVPKGAGSAPVNYVPDPDALLLKTSY